MNASDDVDGVSQETFGQETERSSEEASSLDPPPYAQDRSCPACGPKAERPDELRATLVRRLSRVEGQVRGIKRMVEEDVYCDDVLGQIAAARSALDSAGLILMEHHLRHCVAARMRSGDEAIVDELKSTIGKLLRS